MNVTFVVFARSNIPGVRMAACRILIRPRVPGRKLYGQEVLGTGPFISRHDPTYICHRSSLRAPPRYRSLRSHHVDMSQQVTLTNKFDIRHNIWVFICQVSRIFPCTSCNFQRFWKFNHYCSINLKGTNRVAIPSFSCFCSDATKTNLTVHSVLSILRFLYFSSSLKERLIYFLNTAESIFNSFLLGSSSASLSWNFRSLDATDCFTRLWLHRLEFRFSDREK